MNKFPLGLWGAPTADSSFMLTGHYARQHTKIATGADELAEEDPEAEDLHETQLNRLFDRMSGYTGLPASLIALEYLRYRGSRKKG